MPIVLQSSNFFKIEFLIFFDISYFVLQINFFIYTLATICLFTLQLLIIFEMRVWLSRKYIFTSYLNV